MCGIVGLFIKDPSLEPELGRLTAGMLATLSDRGPDSAGFAVYGAGKDGRDQADAARGLGRCHEGDGRHGSASAFSDANIMLHDTHAVVALDDRSLPRLMEWLAREAPDIEVVGRGPAHGGLQGGRPPGDRGRALRPCRHDRHARHRPYPHGDGVGGDHRRRPSLLDRQGPVPRA